LKLIFFFRLCCGVGSHLVDCDHGPHDDDGGEPNVAVTLKSALLFMCTFCFGQGLNDLYDNVQILQIAEPFCAVLPESVTLQQCCDLLPTLLNQANLRCQANLLSWEAPGVLGYVVCCSLGQKKTVLNLLSQVSMLGQGVFFFSVVLLVEYRAFPRMLAAWRQRRSKGQNWDVSPPLLTDATEDAGVSNERQEVAEEMGMSMLLCFLKRGFFID
jgi:hypothetical protein